jgi:hypothetical protein
MSYSVNVHTYVLYAPAETCAILGDTCSNEEFYLQKVEVKTIKTWKNDSLLNVYYFLGTKNTALMNYHAAINYV